MDEDPPPRLPGIVGFHTYADDTPRPLDPYLAGRPLPPDDDDLDDEADAAWEPDSFASSAPPADEPRGRWGLVATVLIVSVATLTGIATFRMTADRLPPRSPIPATATAPNLQIQIAQAPPPTPQEAPLAPPRDLRLEMLRPSVVPQDRKPPSPASPVFPPRTASLGSLATLDPSAAAPPPPSAQTSTQQVSAPPVTADPQPPPPAAPVPQPSEPAAERSAARGGLPGQLDCDRPASPGEHLICGDAELLAADRRMVQAYARADAAGVPPRILRTEQVNWLNAREAASRRSRDAVDRLYRQRIRDLDSEASDSR